MRDLEKVLRDDGRLPKGTGNIYINKDRRAIKRALERIKELEAENLAYINIYSAASDLCLSLVSKEFALSLIHI